jgi:hypothetical protein
MEIAMSLLYSEPVGDVTDRVLFFQLTVSAGVHL